LRSGKSPARAFVFHIGEIKKMKNTLRQFIVVFFGLAIGIASSILALIYGWGLEPKSWAWIIGAGFFGQMLAVVIMEIGKDNPK
jgi:RsiW-degrading membrane proteinase PrsW (M82 family)